jgi:hypothetical protein
VTIVIDFEYSCSKNSDHGVQRNRESAACHFD